jgi:hypothetical protein
MNLSRAEIARTLDVSPAEVRSAFERLKRVVPNLDA